MGIKLSYSLNKFLKNFVSLVKYNNKRITAYFQSKKQRYGKKIKIYLNF